MTPQIKKIMIIMYVILFWNKNKTGFRKKSEVNASAECVRTNNFFSTNMLHLYDSLTR